MTKLNKSLYSIKSLSLLVKMHFCTKLIKYNMCNYMLGFQIGSSNLQKLGKPC